MLDLRSILAVLIGGGVGSVLRYLVGFWMVQRLGAGFPWHTLAINVVGSLVIGMVGEASQVRAIGMAPVLRVFLMVGVLGGFTTFSSFSYEALNLLGERAGWLSLAYAIGSVVLGIAAAFLGVVIVRAFATHNAF
ncbi:MAG: fluoride efflux transporter CrcB [Candidatus Eremiobacteraeota bacterium]|nr:fluoride efflux transporter CrcB [Candidatus Eremiobacteraeota bacterium]